MSLDKSRILKLNDSSRKFIAEKQRGAMNDPLVERITRTRTDKGKKVSGIIVETRSQKSSEGQKARLEVEIHSDPAVPVGHIWKFDLEEHENTWFWNEILFFQKFEWSLSCSVFSRQLKTENKRSERPN